MRISDWSPDVCSSDLSRASVHDTSVWVEKAQLRITSWHGPSRPSWNRRATTSLSPAGRSPSGRWVPPIGVTPAVDEVRSEEHTSEIQSLMRISYAVFCLKKKTDKKNTDKASME